MLLAAFAITFVACNKDKDEPDDIVVLNIPIDYAVDLGLESGTKWSKMNIGAENPWDYGNYYAWGEITTKSDYSPDTYKYGYNKKGAVVTKYCNDAAFGENGKTDNLTTLLLEDDAASANWGNNWAIPTREEWIELYKQCYWVWTANYNNTGKAGNIVYKAKQDGDKGQSVYGDKTPSDSYSLTDVHIFIPAAGGHLFSDISGVGRSGYYWSASLDINNCPTAYCSRVSNDTLYYDCNQNRSYGLSVRPIWRNK